MTQIEFERREMEQASFRLLSSSTIRQYYRAALSLRVVERLQSQFEDEPRLLEVAVDSAREHWNEVLGESSRTPAEVKLTVLITALSDVASDEADQLLRSIAMSNHESAAWVAGLARNLWRDRRASSDCVLPLSEVARLSREDPSEPQAFDLETGTVGVEARGVESRDLKIA